MFFFDDNNIWDEFEWESHINEMTQRYEYLRHLIEYEHEERPRWLLHLNDFPTKLDAVDAFIEEELLIEESHFPLEEEDFGEDEADNLFENPEEEEEDEWDTDEDEDLFDEVGLGRGPFDDDDEDDMERLFEDIYEEESSESSLYDYASFENVAIYTDSRDFAADLLVFNDNKPEYMRHRGFIRLVSETLLISSKLAAAYSMGFDPEVLGANIAYCKKALAKANNTLHFLGQLKEDPIHSTDYYELHRRLFELRNNIAIHIQDTRDLFNSLL